MLKLLNQWSTSKMNNHKKQKYNKLLIFNTISLLKKLFNQQIKKEKEKTITRDTKLTNFQSCSNLQVLVTK